jgi:hypothetical protein
MTYLRKNFVEVNIENENDRLDNSTCTMLEDRSRHRRIDLIEVNMISYSMIYSWIVFH